MGKKALLIGSLVTAVLLAAVAVGGVVLAQTPSPSPALPGASSQAAGNGSGATGRQGVDNFLNALAQNLGISRSTLDNALKTTAKQQVDQAVSAGKLTQQQATQIDQRIENGRFPFRLGEGFGHGHGDDGAGRNGPSGAALRACGANVQKVVTGTLGISASDLRQARENGETIAQIAQDHGTTVQALQSAVGDAVKSCLDQQVQAGTISAGQEQSVLQRIQQRLTAPPRTPSQGGNDGQ